MPKLLSESVSPSPFNELPNELLCLVFRHVISDFNHPLGQGRDSPLGPLLLVSRHWRDIALRDPSLWAYLYVDPMYSSEEDECPIRQQLARSAGHPLGVHISAIDEGPALKLAFKWLEDSLSRIQDLVVNVGHAVHEETTSAAFAALTELRTLRIANMDTIPWPARHFDKLIELEITQYRYWRPAAFTALLRALAGMPLLQLLSISFQGAMGFKHSDYLAFATGWETEPHPALVLPVLKTLVLKDTIGPVLRKFCSVLINAREVKELEVVGMDDRRVEDWSQLEVPFGGVRKVVIAGWDDTPGLLSRIADESQSITEIDIRKEHSPRDVRDHPLLTNDFPSLRLIRASGSSKGFACHLAELSVSEQIEVILEIRQNSLSPAQIAFYERERDIAWLKKWTGLRIEASSLTDVMKLWNAHWSRR